jgi:hypothetical protein
MAIDEGTHPEEFQGEFKGNVQKVRLGFELPLKKHVFNPDKGEEPFTLSMQMTNSMHEKAKMRKLLESWRGKPYTEESLAKFKKVGIPALLGQPCLINVIHKEKTGGGHFANIAAITPLPEGMVCPPAVLPPILYSVDDGPNSPVFKALSKWLQEEIAPCLEWRPKVTDTDPNHNTGTGQSDGGNSPEESGDPF